MFFVAAVKQRGGSRTIIVDRRIFKPAAARPNGFVVQQVHARRQIGDIIDQQKRQHISGRDRLPRILRFKHVERGSRIQFRPRHRARHFFDFAIIDGFLRRVHSRQHPPQPDVVRGEIVQQREVSRKPFQTTVRSRRVVFPRQPQIAQPFGVPFVQRVRRRLF